MNENGKGAIIARIARVNHLAMRVRMQPRAEENWMEENKVKRGMERERERERERESLES